MPDVLPAFCINKVLHNFWPWAKTHKKRRFSRVLTFNSKISPRYEYRWKIERAYHQRTNKQPYLKGEWVTSKTECYKDFLKKTDELDGNHQAYLYKRIVLPEHFLVFGKTSTSIKSKLLFIGRNLSGPCTNQSGEEDWENSSKIKEI